MIHNTEISFLDDLKIKTENKSILHSFFLIRLDIF